MNNQQRRYIAPALLPLEAHLAVTIVPGVLGKVKRRDRRPSYGTAIKAGTHTYQNCAPDSFYSGSGGLWLSTKVDEAQECRCLGAFDQLDTGKHYEQRYYFEKDVADERGL